LRSATIRASTPGIRPFRNALDRPTRVLNIHAPGGFDRRLLGE
jgi:hypothetical protein